MNTMEKLKSIAALIAVTLVLGTASCKKWNEEPGGGGGSSSECKLTGTLVKPVCGYSALNNLWILASNGKYYQPCANDVINITPESFKEGDEVTFGFRGLKKEETCKEELILCEPNAGRADYRVALTCITKKVAKIETATGYFRDYKKLDGCNWVFETMNGTKFEVESVANGYVIEKDKKATITFIRNNNAASICMVGAIIQVQTIKYDEGKSEGCNTVISGKSPDKKQTVNVYKAWTEGSKLMMTLTFNGCSFETENIKLYHEETIHASDPPGLRFKLGNLPEEQACEAHFTKTICFDLQEIAPKGSYYILYINGYADPISFEW